MVRRQSKVEGLKSKVSNPKSKAQSPKPQVHNSQFTIHNSFEFIKEKAGIREWRLISNNRQRLHHLGVVLL